MLWTLILILRLIGCHWRVLNWEQYFFAGWTNWTRSRVDGRRSVRRLLQWFVWEMVIDYVCGGNRKNKTNSRDFQEVRLIQLGEYSYVFKALSSQKWNSWHKGQNYFQSLMADIKLLCRKIISVHSPINSY